MTNFLAAFLGRSGLVLSAPTADGTAGLPLVTNGSAVLSFATLGLAGGGTNATTAAGARVSVLPAMAGNTLKFLRVNAGETDAEWATVAAGSGDVVGPASAVSANLASFSGTTGKLIQDSGVSAASFAAASHAHSAADITSGTLLAVRGGTGFGSYAVGDLLYADSTTTLAKHAVGAAGTVLIGGTTPAWSNVPTLTGSLLISATTPSVAGGLLHVASAVAATGVGTLEQANASADAFDLNFRKARGTVAAPTVITTADEFGVINFAGYGGAAGYIVGAAIKGISRGTIANSRVPGHISFWAGTNAQPSVLTEIVRITSTGIGVGEGGYNPTDPLSVSGNITATGQVQANSGVYSASTLRVDTLAGIGGAHVAAQQLTINLTSVTNKGLVIKGAASQSANLQEWQDSAGLALASISATGTVNLADGTAAAPSLTFASDLDTGLYRITGNRVGIACNGVVSMVFRTDSVSPQFDGTAAATALNFGSDTDTGIFHAGNMIGISTGGLENIRFQQTTQSALMTIPTSTLIGLVIKGATSQAASRLQLQTSAGTSLGNVGGCIFDHFADGASASVDGTEDTLYTDTTAANTLGINGDSIEGGLTITIVPHAASTDRIQGYFAGISIFDSTALTYAAAGTVKIRWQIIRVTSTTCRAVVEFFPAGSSAILAFATVKYTSDATLTGLNLAATNIIKWTGIAAGVGAAVGDITARIEKIKWASQAAA